MSKSTPNALNAVDPDGLLEYSVVYTDRALNHMSQTFQTVMTDISAVLKSVYQAQALVIVPGSGTSGMEAVARQFANQAECLIIRNGWFSYRWTQILQKAKLTDHATVLNAQPVNQDALHPKPFAPVPIEEAVDEIQTKRPQVVFAPHVETSAGLILPEDYIRKLAQATHEVGGLLVIDCIASGCVWLDMQDLGIDVLITAPQKGWSSTPCAGLVLLSERALERMQDTESDSFSLDLKKWHDIMQAYESGGHAYHATMPTDGLRQFRDTLLEAKDYGFERLKSAQWELGDAVRERLAAYGVVSVAAKGFCAPGVVVSYTQDETIHKGQAFANQGMQIAAGVPLEVGEADDFKTFRIGLFGFDKLYDVPAAVQRLDTVLNKIYG